MSNPIAISQLIMARRHVEGGRRIVAAQEALVARIKAKGEDSSLADDILHSFRRTPAIFEADLLRLTETANSSAAMLPRQSAPDFHRWINPRPYRETFRTKARPPLRATVPEVTRHF